MTTPPTIVPLPNRESPTQRANDLPLVLGVAGFVFGVAMLSRSMLLSQPATHMVPTTHTTLGQVERWAPTRDERSVAMTPLADRGASTPVQTTASRGGTGVVAACTPRRALECDLRLGLMQMALQQRGLFLGPPVAPSEQAVPAKYRAQAHAEEPVAHAAAAPPAAPRARHTPAC